MSEKTLEGSPKIPAPMMPLIAMATRSQRRMPRTRPSSVWFCTGATDYSVRMIRSKQLFALGILCLLSVSAVAQQAKPSLQDVVDRAAKTTLERFADKKLDASQLSITLIDLRDAQHPVTASFRGNERVYPASVVKLFYLVAAERWLEDKKIEQTPELTRAVRDMIVDSSNEATQYVVDVLTHTTGGYELPPKEMEVWQKQRNAANRYFASLGYTNINVNQKTFCEDAYGRERVSRGPNGENRNKLTTDATARLLMEIVTGKIANVARTAAMMELLKREYTGTSTDNDDQGRGFTGIALKGVEGAH